MYRDRSIEDYIKVIGRREIEEITEIAKDLEGIRIVHINATAYGGGVAEILSSLVPLMNSVGLRVKWSVIRGDERFFKITKSIHNALQGNKSIKLSRDDMKYYVEVASKNSDLIDENYDVVVIHDPQPLPLVRYRGSNHWLWRCHIDLSDPNEEVWKVISGFVNKFDAAIFTHEKYVPRDLRVSRVYIKWPAIDPLTDKNRDLSEDVINEVLIKFDVDPERPLIGQVSRFDPWKNTLGVIDTYRLVKKYCPEVQLAIIGSFAHDDPEGEEWYRKTLNYAGSDRDIHILTNKDGVGSLEVNAFQRAFNVALQLSIREGFGLAVTEALWKGTPVVATAVGGIPLQVINGFNGYLVGSASEAAAKVIKLLRRPWLAKVLGINGREHVRRNFLITRLLKDYLLIIKELISQTQGSSS